MRLLALLFVLFFSACSTTGTIASKASKLEGGYAWDEPFVYDLRDHVTAEECTPLGCVITPALDRAVALCEQELEPLPNGNRKYTGCTFKIPVGDHKTTKTHAFCRAHTIEGAGGALRRSNSTITATTSVFHGRGYGDCNMGSSAGALTIRNLGFIFPNLPHPKPIVAIKAEAKVYVENVWIIHADVGVWVTGDVTRTPPSNANGARLTNVHAEYTRHAGIIFNGGDSSGGADIGPNASTACLASPEEMVGLEAQFGPCGSIVDRSFLGNAHVGGAVASASAYPDLRAIGASNHASFFGVYVEGTTPSDFSAPWSMWVGGHGAVPTGTGLRLDGTQATGFRIRNDVDPANPVTTEFGRVTASGGAFYSLRHETNNWPLRMKWVPSLNSGSFLWDIANAGLARVLSIRGTRNGSIPPGGDSDALGRTKLWDVEAILPPQ